MGEEYRLLSSSPTSNITIYMGLEYVVTHQLHILVAIIWLHIKIQQGSKDKALPLQA
jgi:hypothetical protein